MRRAFLAAVLVHLVLAAGGPALAAWHRVGLTLAFDGGNTTVTVSAAGAVLRGTGAMRNRWVVYPITITSGYVQGNYVHLVGVMQGRVARMPFTLTANKLSGFAGWSINGSATKVGQGSVTVSP